MTKIYFAAPIRGGRQAEIINTCHALITDLKKENITVLCEHTGDKNLTDMGEMHLTNQEIYDRDINWVNESDAIIAECTNLSLGVGFEIGFACATNKKILALSNTNIRQKRLSAMISGCPNVTVVEYTSYTQVKEKVMEFIQNIRK